MRTLSSTRAPPACCTVQYLALLTTALLAEKRELSVALLRASRRLTHRSAKTAISHGQPQRSLTVLDNCQYVTIVAVVLVVACDDTGVSNEPGAVTGTATVRSVSRMDSYA